MVAPRVTNICSHMVEGGCGRLLAGSSRHGEPRADALRRVSQGRAKGHRCAKRRVTSASPRVGDRRPRRNQSAEARLRFRRFREALEFTNKVGELAEEEGHHPALLTEWGRTTVTWWTHKIKGLHRNDFIMAAKPTSCFDSEPAPRASVMSPDRPDKCCE